MNWLKLVLNQISEIDRSCSSDVKDAFRTRARQMISILYYTGLTYTFALCVARSSEDLVFKTDSLADLCQRQADKEEVSYALYSKCLLMALSGLGIKGEDLIKTLDELQTRESELGVEISQYCEWLKRLAEAKFSRR